MRLKDAFLTGLAATGILLAIQAWSAKTQMGNQLKNLDSEDIEQIAKERNIRFVVIGDSLAVGLGAERYIETPGIVITKIIAEQLDCHVDYYNFGMSGACSRDLYDQTTKAIDKQPDIALIVIGSNDIIGLKNQNTAISSLGQSINRLRGTGATVYVVPCIDLEVVYAIGQPLRWLLSSRSRRYATMQALETKVQGGLLIDYRPILNKFRDDHRLFGLDGFHPSSAGYKIISEHIAEHIIKNV